jgi:protein-disulfide isomerase
MNLKQTFAITYDYLCPFARVANETIVDALADGAPYDVTFRPFSLSQNHLDEGDIAVRDRVGDDQGRGVLALLWSVAIRDGFPESFLAFHKALFNARHDDGVDLGGEAVLADVAKGVGLDASNVVEVVASGIPAKTLAAEHTDLVATHSVFGVPTFIAGDAAVFVRLMERHRSDDIDRVIEMLTWTNLNEYKHTTISR